MVGVSIELTEKIREKIGKANAEIDTKKVIIGAIHTHTGPGFTGRGANASTKYLGKANSFRVLLEEKLPADKNMLKR